MEALLVEAIPEGQEWLYEPKWDGFRCLVFRNQRGVILQSKGGRPLGRYFPELVENLLALSPGQFVIDGEIIIPTREGLDFNQLLQRIHPAASRVRKLASEFPAHLVVFDLLVDEKGKSLVQLPFAERRLLLERFARRYFPKKGSLHLSPATMSRAKATAWLDRSGGGWDGIMAKRRDMPYVPGERIAMQKFKPLRTADCVVGGFRYADKAPVVASLLLGLYENGLLHHVGFTSSFSSAEKKALIKTLRPLIQPPGFTGRAPGGPSRWGTARSAKWNPLRTKLVVEVAYDHVTDDRFRHGTRFIRWRPDKAPVQCTLQQIKSTAPFTPAFLRNLT